MVTKIQINKFSDMSLDRLEAYAMNYKILVPETLKGDAKKQFLVAQMIAKNDGKDEISQKVSVTNDGQYKGVLKCVCTKCREAKAVRPDVYAVRVQKFGSEEALLKSYLCRECRKE